VGQGATKVEAKFHRCRLGKGRTGKGGKLEKSSVPVLGRDWLRSAASLLARKGSLPAQHWAVCPRGGQTWEVWAKNWLPGEVSVASLNDPEASRWLREGFKGALHSKYSGQGDSLIKKATFLLPAPRRRVRRKRIFVRGQGGPWKMPGCATVGGGSRWRVGEGGGLCGNVIKRGINA